LVISDAGRAAAGGVGDFLGVGLKGAYLAGGGPTFATSESAGRVPTGFCRISTCPIQEVSRTYLSEISNNPSVKGIVNPFDATNTRDPVF
jgi:hypothetical protein